MKRKLLTVILSACLLTGAAAAQTDGLTATAYQTVNVRSGPGAQYEIVGQLSSGDSVPATGRDSDTSGWLQVELPEGETGWVSSFTVLLDGDAADLPVIVVNAAVSHDPAATILATAYGLVNVRSGPGMEYAIIDQLDRDTTVEVEGRSSETNDWLYVVYDETQGWIAYFTVTVQGDPKSLPVMAVDGSGGMAVPAETVTKTLFNVRLRVEPDLSSRVLGMVPFDETVTPLYRSEDWVYVVYQNTEGWGLARLFALTTEQFEALLPYSPSPKATATPPG